MPGVLCTALGAIQLGSKTAFTDLVGSFIILTTTSYALAIAPHLLTGRRHVPPGPFWMGKFGPAINAITVALIIFFNIMFCFRTSLQPGMPVLYPSTSTLTLTAYAYPTTTSTMNYNSAILAGVVVLTSAWWVFHGRANYPGPKLTNLYIEDTLGHVVQESSVEAPKTAHRMA